VKGGSHARDLRRKHAQVVAVTRVFDLVDLCAQIRQHQRGERPWQEPGQVQNLDALQGRHLRSLQPEGGSGAA
jgi:hypothetical protein